MGASEEKSQDRATEEQHDADDVSTDEQPSSDGRSAEEQEPTAQATALRRQQRYAAAGGSLLAGLAVTISILQRFPNRVAVSVLLGVASAFVIYRLAASSVFPGEVE